METKNENKFIAAEVTAVADKDFVVFEGMGETEAKAFKPILHDFVTSYTQKAKDVSVESWLTQKLTAELPDKSPTEIQSISREIISSVTTFDKNLASINEDCDNGKLKEVWFKEKIQDACSDMSVNEYGNYLANIDRDLYQTNVQMMRTIQRQDGGISQNPNLDGFIAEQQHVNDFNTQAALENQSYRAYVQAPGEGGYAKNSFDITIKAGGKIIHQYQAKFGKDADRTIAMIKSGDYHNQRLLVPADQVEAVQKAFPDKTVTAYIGGTDKISTKSNGLTKADVKKQQLDAQAKNKIKDTNWDNISTEKVALNLGQNALLTGGLAARNAVGFYLAKKILSGEKINPNEMVKEALETGADAGVKAAAAGALKVASEKEIISMLPKGTPAGIIANIACVGIENCKIIWKCVKGEISVTKAIDLMGRTTTSMVAGLAVAAKGAAIGASVGSIIPVVGTAVGGFIGGAVGYLAGSEIGNVVYEGAKKVAHTAKTFVQTAYNAAKSVGNAIVSGAKSVANAVSNVVTSVVSTVSDIGSSIVNGFKSIFN